MSLVVVLGILVVLFAITTIVFFVKWQRASAELHARGQISGLLEAQKIVMEESFTKVGNEVLKESNNQFFNQAKEYFQLQDSKHKSDFDNQQKLVTGFLDPVKESLQQMQKRIEQFDQDRSHSQATVLSEIQNVVRSSEKLSNETGRLVQVLHNNSARGQWGELQLRRVVEMAGMLEHCDFEMQESKNKEAGKIRPDMVIHLPGERVILVDSKFPMTAYFGAWEAESEDQRKKCLVEHAKKVKDHIKNLSAKKCDHEYNTPEFVIMYLPGESIFQTALQADPSLVEYGIQMRIILASPTTFMALLKTVAYGWIQEKQAKNAHEVWEIAKTMYEAFAVFDEHFSKLGKNVQETVKTYNAAVGSYEKNLRNRMRKMVGLGVQGAKELTDRGELRDCQVRELPWMRVEGPNQERS